MKYTNRDDIYENIDIGMKIIYRRYASDGIREGIVTDIVECDICNDDNPCHIEIGINGRNPDCFMAKTNKTFILEIRDNDFIEKDEFSI